MSLIGSTSFGFAQNTIHDFQKKLIDLIVALSSTNVTERTFECKENFLIFHSVFPGKMFQGN